MMNSLFLNKIHVCSPGAGYMKKMFVLPSDLHKYLRSMLHVPVLCDVLHIDTVLDNGIAL